MAIRTFQPIKRRLKRQRADLVSTADTMEAFFCKCFEMVPESTRGRTIHVVGRYAPDLIEMDPIGMAIA